MQCVVVVAFKTIFCTHLFIILNSAIARLANRVGRSRQKVKIGPTYANVCKRMRKAPYRAREGHQFTFHEQPIDSRCTIPLFNRHDHTSVELNDNSGTVAGERDLFASEILYPVLGSGAGSVCKIKIIQYARLGFASRLHSVNLAVFGYFHSTWEAFVGQLNDFLRAEVDSLYEVVQTLLDRSCISRSCLKACEAHGVKCVTPCWSNKTRPQLKLCF